MFFTSHTILSNLSFAEASFQKKSKQLFWIHQLCSSHHTLYPIWFLLMIIFLLHIFEKRSASMNIDPRSEKYCFFINHNLPITHYIIQSEFYCGFFAKKSKTLFCRHQPYSYHHTISNLSFADDSFNICEKKTTD